MDGKDRGLNNKRVKIIMDINYFRSSSYNCYEMCPQQYFLSYVLAVPQDTNHKASLGSCTHKILECLGNIKLELQHEKHSGEITDDSLGIISWSEDAFYTDDFTYMLVDKSFDYFSTHSENIWTETDKKDIWNWCKIVLNDKNFDPRYRTIVEAEQYFDVPLELPWAKLPNGDYLRLKGTIDLVTQVDKTIEVIDWKTSQKRMNWSNFTEKTYADFQKDPQLLLYFRAISKLYPDKTILITVYYIRHGGGFTLAFTDKDIGLIEHLLEQQFLNITSCQNPSLKDGGNGRFCKYICSYGKNRSKYDPSMSECQFFHREVNTVGIDAVVRRYTDNSHSLDHYEEPGK